MLSPRYQLNASGLYQLGWGINVAGNMTMRGRVRATVFRDSAVGRPLGDAQARVAR
jgi:hypothetical protein